MGGKNATRNSIDLTITNKTGEKAVGTAHIHTDGLYDIFSIQYFFGFIELLKNAGVPANEKFSIVMNENNHYMFTFDGNDDDFKNIGNLFKDAPQTMEEVEGLYERYETRGLSQE